MDYIEIDDDYEHFNYSLEYVLENVLMEDDGTTEYQELRDIYNSQIVQSCLCLSKHSTCSSNICFHGNNYILDPDGNELLLNLTENNQRPIIECGPFCACTGQCGNRLVQLGPRKYLQLFNSLVYKSKGLRTNKKIPKGAFICEYAGELLTYKEALRRTKSNDQNKKNNYVLILNEYQTDGVHKKKFSTIVDPAERGNIGRYLNHSCDPNCLVKAVRVDCPIPKICIFAKRDIEAFEELCFHYGEGNLHSLSDVNLGTECLCASISCSNFLPNNKI